MNNNLDLSARAALIREAASVAWMTWNEHYGQAHATMQEWDALQYECQEHPAYFLVVMLQESRWSHAKALTPRFNAALQAVENFRRYLDGNAMAGWCEERWAEIDCADRQDRSEAPDEERAATAFDRMGYSMTRALQSQRGD